MAYLTGVQTNGERLRQACVVTNIIAILACVLAYFYLAGHELGIVEAVSISVLLGSSVDYSLHIAAASMECCLEHSAEEPAPDRQHARRQVSAHSLLMRLHHWLFTPELQWQSRG